MTDCQRSCQRQNGPGTWKRGQRNHKTEYAIVIQIGLVGKILTLRCFVEGIPAEENAVSERSKE